MATEEELKQQIVSLMNQLERTENYYAEKLRQQRAAFEANALRYLGIEFPKRGEIPTIFVGLELEQVRNLSFGGDLYRQFTARGRAGCGEYSTQVFACSTSIQDHRLPVEAVLREQQRTVESCVRAMVGDVLQHFGLGPRVNLKVENT